MYMCMPESVWNLKSERGQFEAWESNEAINSEDGFFFLIFVSQDSERSHFFIVRYNILSKNNKNQSNFNN